MNTEMDQADVDGMTGTMGQLLSNQLEDLERAEDLAASRVGDFVATTISVDPRLYDMFKEMRKIEKIVGIDKPIAELISMMSLSSQQPKVVSIWGHGGMGKTALAEAVYDKIKGDFYCSAFVTVGQQPDLNKILRDILIHLGNKTYRDLNMTILNERLLIDELQYFLQSKRFLIVIDDIRDVPLWEVIKSALVDSGCGSRIITTSRVYDVSKRSDKIFEIMPLSIDDSKELFHGSLFGHKGTNTFDPLDEQSIEYILQKCGGLPLAISVTASLLASRPQKEWPTVYDSIRFGREDSIHLRILRKMILVGFYDLPAHLSTCFLYLGTFPKGYLIEKDTVVCQWIAEGFVHSEQEESLFDAGERYFNDLIKRGMIQAIEDEYTNMTFGCRVHDMVLDLILHWAEVDNFLTIYDGVKHLSYIDTRVIAAQNRVLKEEHDLDRIVCNPKVRSFIGTGCHISSTTMSLLSSSFQVLRVLSLEGCEVPAAQYSDSLKHLAGLLELRYLGLRGTNIRYLPMDIGALKYLQTLDLRDTCIEALPHRVTLLRQLKYLRCSDSVLELPQGMGNLASLEHLRLGAVGPYFAKELSKLKKLRVLRIGLENLGDKEKEALVEAISKLKELKELVLIFDGLGSEEPCRTVMAPGAFPRLRYLKTNNWLTYQPGAMPWVESVELSVHVRAFNDANFDFHYLYSLRYLPGLMKANVAIVCWEARTVEAAEAEATLRRVVQHHPNHPRLILTRIGRCIDDKEQITADSYSRGSDSSQQGDVPDRQIIHSLGDIDKLHHSQVAHVFPLELLKAITQGFSKKRELGSGTFGTVYKGVQLGKEIAVKLLHPNPVQRHDYEGELRKELDNLKNLKHPNIIQLLGYCYEIKFELEHYKGMQIFAGNIYRALCFEYMHNGSLQGHLQDEFHGSDWQTRYKIIKGICEGLKYLHEGLESPMYHLDLKPGNILLDKNKVAKLADFGLARIVSGNQTQATQRALGTVGYCPPEYIDGSLVNNKFDIFSLGVVMMEIIAGSEGCRKIRSEMPRQEFTDHVQENWRRRLQETPGSTSSLIYECRQVKRCIEIALHCMNPDRTKRPNIGEITSWLNEIEKHSNTSF